MLDVYNTLIFPAEKLNNFNKLPISLKPISSDIINVGFVIKYNPLAMAIRVTFAISALFSIISIYRMSYCLIMDFCQ